MRPATTRGHHFKVQAEKPSRMRVISGSSVLKWEKTSANFGRTKTLMTISATAIAMITMTG